MEEFDRAEDIKVGVIGYGGAFDMGQEHLEQMQRAGMTPCAVADMDEARLQVAGDDFPGIQTYTAAADMLSDSDVNLVTIITPHNTHAPLAEQCLRAGRHVVVEKPMAVSTEECDLMIELAREGDLLLSTYHNRHWDGCALRAVEQVREKAVIGDVYRIEAHMGGYGKPGDWWRSNRSVSGGILFDWGVHLLEYSLQLLDGNLVEVSGFNHTGYWADRVRWGGETNEDEARAVARFDNGQWLTLTISNLDTCPKNAERKWVEVTGTEGTYMFDGGSWRTVVQGPDGPAEEEGSNPEGQRQRYYDNVAAALLGEEDLIITPEWARRPIHILDLAVRSAERGRTLEAAYD
ncbi:MAG: Gfo/Idh/MocA family protein [Planctomycetota bacterium]